MGVVGCVHLVRRKRTEKFELKRLKAKSLKSLSRAIGRSQPCFPRHYPFCQRRQEQGVESKIKGAQGEQHKKIACERIKHEQSKRRKAPEEKRFVRTVVGAVCLL